jgi:hypothetical protein
MYGRMKEKVVGEINEGCMGYIRESHPAYLKSYCQERGITEEKVGDSIDLFVYISQRLQSDNNWLVDKLAEVEEEKSRFLEKSAIQEAPSLKQLKELGELSKQSTRVLETFSSARSEFKRILEGSGQENQGYRANEGGKSTHNFNSNSNRESIQSQSSARFMQHKQMGKSMSGRNINSKFNMIVGGGRST